jgi:hypothetical protein
MSQPNIINLSILEIYLWLHTFQGKEYNKLMDLIPFINFGDKCLES